ncbi:AraC family transcriptional regulator [Cohnella sp. REN36]|uniref:AraC family transcriptional regulator n=1 Tax=Cohnella sp. REN36 TaxID=2887347 RepID=UPI001D14A126|nr:AraC family transcriptional regulator [Cohnella sp. REN36]MCC3373351.1 AraC family transcriptional regulator [Cohnella sp. REN36]
MEFCSQPLAGDRRGGDRLESSWLIVNPHLREGDEATVLFTGRSQTAPDHRVGPQVLDYVLIHTVEAGKGYFKCGEEEYELGPGDSFFILPGPLHAYRSDERDPWRYRWIACRGPELARWQQRAGVSAERPVVYGAWETLRAMEAVAAAFREGGWTADCEASGWLRIAWAAWMKTNRPEAPEASGGREEASAREADRAARWLHAQLDRPVSIAQMARELGYHRTHLAKLFRRHRGMSPIRYLQKLRMERAALLLQEALSVEEVAASVGYADPLYFSKSFKKWMGVTPTDYRKGLRS